MIDILKQAALAAGTVQFRYFRGNKLQIKDKTNQNDLLTIADVESQNTIQEYIVQELTSKHGIPESEIGFIGEEDLHSTGAHTFIIDPIDGTANFATGSEDFGSLIAYEHEGELQAAVMYFPAKDLMYVAEKGKGATVIKRGVTTQLSMVKKELNQTFFHTSLSYRDDIEAGIQDIVVRAQKAFRGVRMIGSAGAELGLLAENIGGTCLCIGVSVWDIAAGKLILDEIGYKVYDWEGQELRFDLKSPKKKYPFFACHPDHRARILEIIADSS